MFKIEQLKAKVTNGSQIFCQIKICKEEEIKVPALHFFEPQIPSQSTSVAGGTDYL